MNPDSQVADATNKCVSDDGYTTVVRRQKRNKVSTIEGQPVNIPSNRVRGLSSKVKVTEGQSAVVNGQKAHYI